MGPGCQRTPAELPTRAREFRTARDTGLHHAREAACLQTGFADLNRFAPRGPLPDLLHNASAFDEATVVRRDMQRIDSL